MPDNINEIQRLMSRSNFSEEDKLQGIRTIIEEYEGGQSAAEEKI